MSELAISVDSLSKRYDLTSQATPKALRQTLTDLILAPYRAVASRFAKNDGTAEEKRCVWALKKVSLEARKGEVVGIIGRNGAGKSTLLKILSRITDPTEGTVFLYGNVGALLEMGTGFHPELSGRENVYLSGAILGMKKSEIDARFDEIVSFAELENFIDTPVKFYSSGMYLRLGFAVAAHLQPDILLVDEVLAVGDASFQRKCLGKTSDVARQGRTVLFVSHNMGSIARLCDRCIWLNDGMIQKDGAPAEVISAYLQSSSRIAAERKWRAESAPGDELARLLAVRVCQPPGLPCSSIDISRPFEVEVEIVVMKPVPEMGVAVRILNGHGEIILHTSDLMNQKMHSKEPGRWISVCRLPAYVLNHGTYTLSVFADIPFRKYIFMVENVLSWTVEGVSSEMGRYDLASWRGVIGPGLADWSLQKVVPS